MKIRVNVAKSTDMKLGGRADVGNMSIEIEMAVKSDVKELELEEQMYQQPRWKLGC